MEKSENFENEEFGVILDPREQRRRLSLAIKKVIYRDLPEEDQKFDFRRHSIHCSGFDFNPSPSFEIVNPICPTGQPSETKSITNPNPTKKFIKRKNSKKLSLKMSLSTDSQSSSASDDSNSA